MLVRPVMKRLFFPWKTKPKKARFARAPYDKKHTKYVRISSLKKNVDFNMTCREILTVKSGFYLRWFLALALSPHEYIFLFFVCLFVYSVISCMFFFVCFFAFLFFVYFVYLVYVIFCVSFSLCIGVTGVGPSL